MGKEWNLVEVDDRIFVPFDWRDPTPGFSNLGRAEFQVCLKFTKKGKLKEFWVYPKQTRLEDYWHFKGGDRLFGISSYQGLEDAKVWLVNWCEEHQATTLNVYSPSDAKFLEVSYHGISFWRTNIYDKGGK